jgi:hypothetical protein
MISTGFGVAACAWMVSVAAANRVARYTLPGSHLTNFQRCHDWDWLFWSFLIPFHAANTGMGCQGGWDHGACGAVRHCPRRKAWHSHPVSISVLPWTGLSRLVCCLDIPFWSQHAVRKWPSLVLFCWLTTSGRQPLACFGHRSSNILSNILSNISSNILCFVLLAF